MADVEVICSGFPRIQRLSAATVSLEAAKTIAKRSKMTSEASKKKEFALPYHSNRYRYHRPEE